MSATKYVYIHTPYFIPNDLVLGAVQMAALSGVDVQAMIPVRSDSRFTDASTSSYMGQVLEAGVRVLRYGGGFLHSKAIVIDDFISIVGSCNMDERSFNQNFELNAFIYEEATACRLRDLFVRDKEKMRGTHPGGLEQPPPLGQVEGIRRPTLQPAAIAAIPPRLRAPDFPERQQMFFPNVPTGFPTCEHKFYSHSYGLYSPQLWVVQPTVMGCTTHNCGQ